MKKTDNIFFGMILGTLIPLTFALIFLSAGMYYKDGNYNAYFFIGGAVAGIIADIIFLRRLLSSLYDIPLWIAASFHVLFNIMIYGFFMGFPVFNVLTGIVAGYYTGRRIIVRNIDEPGRRSISSRVLSFSTLIITIICCSTAFLALREKSIGEQLQGMLGLPFVPGKGMVIALILAGGSFLIITQYLLTRFAMVKTIKIHEKMDHKEKA